MSIRQIRVTVGNESGTLLKLCKILEENDIELRALDLVDKDAARIMRIIVDDVFTCNGILKEHGYSTAVKPVIVLDLEDKPESLPAFLKPLADNGIVLKYGYSFMENRKGRFFMAMRVEDADVERAEDILESAGFKPIVQDDLRRLFV